MNARLINAKSVSLLIILAAVACAALAVPLTHARPRAVAITIVNNSQREILHLYLSPPGEDNWGPDQLNDSVIRPGETFTLGSVSCNGSQVKLIGEDKDGCFLSAVVSCSGNASWTITGETPADCGH